MSKVTILYIDKKNLNGNTFTREASEQMVEDCKGKPIPGYIGMNLDNRGLDESSHLITDMEIVDNKIVGNVVIREDSLNGEKLKSMLESENIVFRTQGEAVVEDDGVVSNYKVASINAVNRDEDSFKE